MTWLRDPTPAGLLLYLSLLSVAAGLVCVATSTRADLPGEANGQQEPSSQAVARVEAMILFIVEKAPRNPANRKPAYRRRISKAATIETERHEIPVGLVPAIMFRESSFDHRKVDKVGAAGLMQVSPCMVKFLRCEMKTPEGQIDCGCRALVYYRSVCGGDWRGAMSAYGSRDAVCNPRPGGKLHWMVNDRFALAAELRGLTGGK